MKYITTTSKASARAVDCVIVGIYNLGKLSVGAADINAVSKGHISDLIKSGDVSGDRGRVTVLNNVPGVKASRVAVVGLGKSSEFDISAFRQAVATAIHAISNSKIKQILNSLTLEPVTGGSPYYLARHTVEAVNDALYRFDQMKSGRKKASMPLNTIALSIAKRGDAAKATRGAEHGGGISAGVSLAKDLGNLPANVCTPSYLARVAKKMASGNGKLSTRVLSESEMKKLGMGSLLSVTAGATEPAKLIVMQYKNGGDEKPVVLVGKGVTFDTGGISLKPGAGMDEMKFDMCGAASVFGTVAAVAEMKLPINLVGIVPATENMPDGLATKPGDIVTSMSGQTIEVLNTDAEGRMILCDALTYAKKFKPDVVIDIATLTGACVIALGKHATGLFSNDQPLADKLLAAGQTTGDRAWQMPIWDEYDEQLSSNFADMANIGGRDAGSITAACFLSRYTKDYRWAHLDIAGVAWKSGGAKGATGRPVPLLTEFLMARVK